MLTQAYLIKNILLETGFIRHDDGTVMSTETKPATLYIKQGKIYDIFWKEIPGHLQSLDVINGCGSLALPGVKDAHIHLDKTYYGGPWTAAEENKTVLDMIAIEKQLLPKQIPFLEQRAKAILDLILSKGTTRIFNHCNVDRTIGTRHFECIQSLLSQDYFSKISYETAAFPQHGLLRDDAVSLMKDVLQMGCHAVGGLDPNAVDRELEKSLDMTFQLALDYKKSIDLHLHERNDTGKKTLKYVFKLLEQNPTLQNKVTISHSFVLYDIHKDGQLEKYANAMKTLGVKLVSSVPIQFKMPLAELKDYGVTVELGTDSITDHWTPFGQGDIIERVNIIAQLYGWANEYHLSRALYFATGKTPLTDDGVLQWPVKDDVADITLFDASCSAEVIARISQRTMTISQGCISWNSKAIEI